MAKVGKLQDPGLDQPWLEIALQMAKLGKLQDLGLDQPWLEIFWAVEVRRAKPGFLLTRVFSRPKMLAPLFGAPQSRRHERPRSSRLQHSTPGDASCRSSASVAQIIAAASIEVMEALFGFVSRDDAEWSK